MSHVIVARKIALSPVTSQKYPCRMSVAILNAMSPVEFRTPCALSNIEKQLCRPGHFRGLDPFL